MVKRLMWSGMLTALGALASVLVQRAAGAVWRRAVRRGAAGVSAATGPEPARPWASGAGAPGVASPRTNAGAGAPRTDGPQNIATAITDVSERVAVLVHEEVELAKAEVTEKAAKLARGAVVAVAAGIFIVTALFFVLIGCAWLLYYYLPIGSEFTYFWGFFAMALILVVLGVLAGLVAAKVVKKAPRRCRRWRSRRPA